MIVKLMLSMNNYFAADGTAPLYLRVSTGEKKKYYPIGIKLEKNQWNPTQGIIKSNYLGATEINPKLFKILGEVKSVLSVDEKHDVQGTINRLFFNVEKHVIQTTSLSNLLIPYFREYVQRCKDGKILKRKTKQQMSAGYIRTFNTTIQRLEAYEKYKKENYRFEDINNEWLNGYITFLRNKYKLKVGREKVVTENSVVGLLDNSIGKDVKHIKSVLSQSVRDKINTNLDFKDFVTIGHDGDTISLTPNEIDAILNLDITNNTEVPETSKPQLIIEQKRFAIAYNFLFRFSDSIKINKSKIITDDDGLHFYKEKSDKTGTDTIIPIRDQVYNILMDDNFKLETENATSNEKLKILGRLAKIDSPVVMVEERRGQKIEKTYKKYELITTHTSRRSAATNLYVGGFDLESIRLFGGWSNLKQLQTYLKIDKIENARKAAKHAFFQ